MTHATIDYNDMREARRQILAVQDPAAQAALFTLLGLVHTLSEQLDNAQRELAR